MRTRLGTISMLAVMLITRVAGAEAGLAVEESEMCLTVKASGTVNSTQGPVCTDVPFPTEPLYLGPGAGDTQKVEVWTHYPG